MTDTERDALIMILWSKPYLTYFGTRCGGLPADWLKAGAVTALSVAKAQQEAGIASAWAIGELSKL